MKSTNYYYYNISGQHEFHVELHYEYATSPLSNLSDSVVISEVPNVFSF